MMHDKGRDDCVGEAGGVSVKYDGHTYVHSAKCYIQGRAFPNRATSERSAVDWLVWRGESYHAGAQLLQQAWALRAAQHCRRPARSDALHAAAQQVWDAAAGVGHRASLKVCTRELSGALWKPPEVEDTGEQGSIWWGRLHPWFMWEGNKLWMEFYRCINTEGAHSSFGPKKQCHTVQTEKATAAAHRFASITN